MPEGAAALKCDNIVDASMFACASWVIDALGADTFFEWDAPPKTGRDEAAL